MHELSLALSILEVAEEAAARHGADRVAAVHVKWGPLSGVVREALLSAYAVACEGSPLAGARLVIEEAPVVAFCPACRAARAVVSVQRLACAACGAPAGELVSGRELEVVALELP